MSDRITNRDLEGMARRINGAVGIPGQEVWTRTDGVLRQNPGVYYIDGAYGGVSLYRTCDVDGNGESHGVNDVFGSGHVPKRDLYNRMRAFCEGIDAARA